MAKTSMINDLVRDGHASPRDGALLMELRQRMGERARRSTMSVPARFLGAIAALIVTLIAGRTGNP